MRFQNSTAPFNKRPVNGQTCVLSLSGLLGYYVTRGGFGHLIALPRPHIFPMQIGSHGLLCLDLPRLQHRRADAAIVVNRHGFGFAYLQSLRRWHQNPAVTCARILFQLHRDGLPYANVGRAL